MVLCVAYPKHGLPRRPLWRLLRHVKPHRRLVLLASFHSILNRMFDLAGPLMFAAAIDVVVEREASLIARFGITDLDGQLWFLAGLTAATWILESVFEYLAKLSWGKLAQAIQHALRSEVYQHVQRLDLGYFKQRSAGDIVCAINDDINQLELFLSNAAGKVIQTVFTLVVVGTSFALMAPPFAWIPLATIPFILASALWFQSLLSARYGAIRLQAGLLGSELTNSLSGLAVIKSYGAERRVAAHIDRVSADYATASERALRLNCALNPVLRVMIGVGVVGVLLAGGGQVLAGTLGAGLFTAILAMTERLLWPLHAFGWLLDAYRHAMASAGRTLALLDERPRLPSPSGADRSAEIRGNIRFENVSFQYEASSNRRAPRTTLEDVSLDVRAGQTVALVGASGAGKSTVLQLLLRFYDPSSGRILLDGRPLDTVPLEALREHVVWVGHEAFFFPGSVRDNIAFGKSGASFDAILAAARTARADDFIRQLPDGYDTLIGERGQTLSIGQQQRLALARAILADPSILLVDEATSAVDYETERAIHRGLLRARAGRTTILVTHRLSSVGDVDKVLLLARGRIVGEGRHAELVRTSPDYARLVATHSAALPGTDTHADSEAIALLRPTTAAE